MATEVEELEVRHDWITRKLQAIARSAVGFAGSLTQQSLTKEKAEIEKKLNDLRKPTPKVEVKAVVNGK